MANEPVRRQRKGGRRLLRFFGEIQQASGVGESMLQRWVEAGVLRSVEQAPSGSGNYRMFDMSELVLAVMLRPLADAGIPLNRLWQISRILRHAMRQRRPTRIIPPEEMPDTVLTVARQTPDGEGFESRPAASPSELEEAREQIRKHQSLGRRYQDLGQAIQRALEGVGTNFAMLVITAEMSMRKNVSAKKKEALTDAHMYPGALSLEAGERPTFDMTELFAEAANWYAASYGCSAPSMPVLMILDLAPLRGLADDLLP
jgi:hypothetical protein